MQDVADLAGVSRTTVSFVINQVPDANIPEETQARVRTAVAELNYRPNAIARGLRAQRTHTIGFISDVVATTPYAGNMIQGAQDFAWENNNIILLVNTGNNQDMKHKAVDVMLQRQVDGIIYATMYHREVHPPESIRQVPAVLLDCFNGDYSLPSVIPDEVLGGRQATEYLLQKGHRRVGFVCDFSPVQAKYGRLQGYQQALAQYGIAFDADLVREGESLTSGGYKATMEIMQQPDPPTALFCYNDRMAMGAYDALRKLGLSIPGDVAVVGFDNQELIAAHLYPALTTMKLPHYEMGQWAVEHLLYLIDHPEARQETAVQHIIPCPIIERESA
ncbi:MAG: LacI family DNA-binding transcriptional regulator [Chloroflexi bacterium]|nr:LacI family DNA-binding transcriptional regulator [Chloroflexota bacterium]MBP7043832.1 LacI family DNA-binding transcriptional regulator [Chloroflexota bacterium]